MEWNNEKKKQGNDRLISFFIVGVMVLIILAMTLLSVLFFNGECAG
ncbi:hypothetical protein [Priestia megaterium]|nr:hypothetical protein [Priestia megaterium]